MAELPQYVSRDLVAERLPVIFSEGTPNRNYCIRELAASTVFAMIYIGAVEGSGTYLGPVHVYRMTGEQAVRSKVADRHKYDKAVRGRNTKISGTRWYADNTREPIRDETLRDGLVAVGAVIARDDLPTTSGQPRYALKADFAALFAPSLGGAALAKAIEDFQAKHLSKSALARVSLIRAGAVSRDSAVRVTFPNGDTRQLSPGPSSIISRAVVEEFATRFLQRPAVLWLSESGNKVVAQDDTLATSIGLGIQADKNLPDLILIDLGPAEPLIVFVEVVATDGAVTERRRDALYALTDEAGFARSQVAFVTAYHDREASGFRKTVSALAWGSFAWFLSEPANILIMRDGEMSTASLADLM